MAGTTRKGRKTPQPRTLSALRYIELTVAPPAGRLGGRLRSSLETLASAPVKGRKAGPLAGGPGGPPVVDVFVRKRAGSGCDQAAEIAGTYTADLAPGQACIGAAAVKQILDDAAAKLCCQTLECPAKCPCSYVPQQALAAYTCAVGRLEFGALLQTNEVFNCVCFST
jgi:hypothetical protein